MTASPTECGCGCLDDGSVAPAHTESRVATHGQVDVDYISLCKRILQSGKPREDRTKIGTISRFGERLDINLREGFPLLTTKRVFWRGVVGELLWFISGSMDSTELSRKGIHIWDGNTSREFLDSRGLHDYPVGHLGPGYGWQWRNFGGDQLKEVIEKIKTNPTDRRLIVSAWNPADLPKMALPPCHIMYQFHVEDGELSCQMYQRSVDVGLGLPFNIASYALLTHIIAHICNLRVGRLIICMGDTHIYQSHTSAISSMLDREPRPLPTLRITAPPDTDIDHILEEHITLSSYNPHPSVAMTMAV